MFKKRRTTTFVNDDDSVRLKELQQKFEVLRLKKLEKQHSVSDLLREKEDKLIKELVDTPLCIELLSNHSIEKK